MIWALAAIAATGYWLLNLHPAGDRLEIDTAFRTFNGLRALSHHEDIKKYLAGKESLRTQLKKSMGTNLSEDEEQFAKNMALYLFPDILPDDEFEKMVALEQWAPLEEAIERKPHTPESRLLFEEMRANIWNFENPGLDSGRISVFAKEVLKIYSDLSSP
jgi:hypothetical protein